ncbi:SDR family oxidoreductase [Phycicoccus duodecadis]|uniref:Putative NADH-flavin reductase n=1 Tax=Phycicoccus duodecadis TaxID=173053 RepID=A0A2N3YLX6_9MICO|nr:SDR family oxidoreductase [Phycicoccus duodecadis]PKW27842.1 putative NADH-flavin reductase [Phycicoccus duodecadis]
MNVLVIGGHGKVARLLHPLLAQRSHTVAAVIRNPEHADDVERDGATPLVADVQQLDTTELTDLVRGYDAVVWSAGAGGGSPERTYAVDRDAAIRSIDAAEAVGVQRYVMVSYFGAGPNHGVPQDDPFFAYAEAKTAADQRLQESALAWTLVRPSALTDDQPTGGIETPRTGAGKGSVPRADVAHVIADVLDRPATAGHVLEFNGGATPVAEELDALAPTPGQ